MTTRQTQLLSEASWKSCDKCKTAIPEFESSKPLQGLLKSNRAWAMHRLMEETGCDLKLAKAWTLHHVEPIKYEPPHTPCPWCSQPLRTERAKQCRFWARTGIELL